MKACDGDLAFSVSIRPGVGVMTAIIRTLLMVRFCSQGSAADGSWFESSQHPLRATKVVAAMILTTDKESEARKSWLLGLLAAVHWSGAELVLSNG